jgi:hypothetical protein
MRNSRQFDHPRGRAATGPFVMRSASSVHTWWPPSVPIALQEQAIDRHRLARRPMTPSPAGERPILGQLG